MSALAPTETLSRALGLERPRLEHVVSRAGLREVLASLDRNFSNYVVNVDAAPEVALLAPRLA